MRNDEKKLVEENPWDLLERVSSAKDEITEHVDKAMAALDELIALKVKKDENAK